MTSPDRPPAEFPIERLIMAVDLTAPDLNAIATVAQIAARLGTMVDAVLLEDINISRLAALPIARQLSLTPPAHAAVVDAAQLDRELRAMARQAEAALSVAARQLGLAWSLRTVRGELPDALTQTLRLDDLLVFGPTEARRVGPAARAFRGIAQRVERSVLLLSGPTVPRHPLVVLKEGSRLGARALAAGLRLLPGGSRVLNVVLAGNGPGVASDAVQRQLAARGVAAQLSRIGADSGGAVVAAINATDCDIAVLAGDLSCVAADGPEDIMVRTSRPVMIVR